MGIQITNADSTPAIVYNKVFMHSLKIEQLSQIDDTKTPKYSLILDYSLYGVDDNAKRYYKPKRNTIILEDYIAAATVKAMQGDMDLVTAMQAIEAAIATIIEDQTNLGSTTIT